MAAIATDVRWKSKKMDAKPIAINITKYSAILLVVIAMFGFLFRATLYWQIPVASGEPAGFGDVIELLIYLSILGVAGFVLVMSIIVAMFKDYASALKGLFVGVVTPVAYYLLHSFVPRLI